MPSEFCPSPGGLDATADALPLIAGLGALETADAIHLGLLGSTRWHVSLRW
ncbi:hypothetical protein ACFVX6_19300 [Streptomyces sp. NPDC058289]|uniref:hypothetical protein n=1 Tax=Streptomyces sp. NPDC058289 TaxID=3346425 RepID=UPI0036F030D1